MAAPKEVESMAKYDPTSGQHYIDLPIPKYDIGNQVVFATHATFQSKISLKVGDEFWKNQLQIGTVVWATFNPDAGATGQKVQWSYIIRVSSGGGRDIPDVQVQEMKICGLVSELRGE